jgi:hypothetical protein
VILMVHCNIQYFYAIYHAVSVHCSHVQRYFALVMVLRATHLAGHLLMELNVGMERCARFFIRYACCLNYINTNNHIDTIINTNNHIDTISPYVPYVQ